MIRYLMLSRETTYSVSKVGVQVKSVGTNLSHSLFRQSCCWDFSMDACVTAIQVKETMSSGVSKVEYMGGVGGEKRREEKKKIKC